ncbi:MAG: hypothetical protein F6J98_15575, partial [Moorea sp. SIO4G2]|nr:hypothetical protein [Moorena sp. SIO4G2]
MVRLSLDIEVTSHNLTYSIPRTKYLEQMEMSTVEQTEMSTVEQTEQTEMSTNPEAEKKKENKK